MKQAYKLPALYGLLGVVLAAGGFYLSWLDEQQKIDHHDQAATTTHHGVSGHDSDHATGHQAPAHGDHGTGTVKPSLAYANSQVQLVFQDARGEPVREFEVAHEKLLHLIIVSDDLSRFRHVHPDLRSDGTFEVNLDLPPGQYTAFADARPAGYSYHVQPLKFSVGDAAKDRPLRSLKVDDVLEREERGVKVRLEPSALRAGVPVTLDFHTPDADPEPYLGALGHVVILDEQADRYIHVHPSSNDKTVFETRFDQPGTYKVWGEFKFDGVVHVYPFVIEVT